MTNLIDAEQFQEDLDWCMEKISHHFDGRPYWEDTTTAYFTRSGSDQEEWYWKIINLYATNKLTKTRATLLHSEAYRELNRMAFFAINVIVGSLDDLAITDKINPQSLEEILTITHKELSERVPDSLSSHDESLKKMQQCINIFCSATNTPLTEFVGYSPKMNDARIMEGKTDT